MLPASFPFLHGNWVDLIIIVVLFWYFLEGLGDNFLSKMFELLSLVVSFISALKFYSFFSFLLVANFSLPKGIANASGFFLAGLLGEAIFSTIATAVVNKIPKAYLVNNLNKALGFVPSLTNGIVLVAFILTLIISLPVNPAVKSAVLSSRLGGPLVLKTQNLERQINQIFGGALNETLNFLTVKPEGKENVDLRFKTNSYSVDNSSEQMMWGLVNKERKDQGTRSLIFDEKLAVVARAHAKDMLERGYFSHNSPEGLSPFDRLKNAGISFETAGENLAFAPNVEIAHAGLMNSPGHRANILNADFGKVGIGVINAGIYGEMFVQEFTN
ncbi:CvpA family protein [Candidatus Gottesmanbacteria bacterium]|nr:CvpA family protein [Candidatus Gottesmanbacteria bacterium]